MSYQCIKCGQTVNHSREFDAKTYYRDQCPDCFSVIFDKDYPKTPGQITLFSATGEALGDKTLFEVIERMYKGDNPEETVICLEPKENHAEAFKKYNPAKFFIAEFARDDLDFKSQSKIHYNMLNEVCLYAKKGIYPKLTYPMTAFPVMTGKKFIVCHFRNIEKVPEFPNPKRNVSTEVAESIVDYLKDYNLVLVGEDDVVLKRKFKNVTDLRYMLSLGETAWLCNRSLLYLGRDSGMIHVAAASGARIFGWGFNGKKWYPKTAVPYKCLQDKDSNIENILKGIGEML